MRLCIFEFYEDPCGAERWELGGGAMVSVELKLERLACPCRDTFE
jgi:hypothetical protein